MGATGGSGVFTAFDNSPAIAGLTVQVSDISYFVTGANGAAAKIPGSMTNLMAGQVNALNSIQSTLTSIADKVTGNATSMTDAAASIQQAISTLSGVLTELAVQHALQVADQVEHNEFQQTATNVARKEAGKEKIEVPPADYKEKVKKGVSNITTIQGVAKVAGTANSIITNVAGTAQSFITSYLADTGIGKYVLEKIAKTKLWMKQSEAEAKAKIKAIEDKAKADQAKTGETPGPTGAPTAG
jgi:hypothetical protein